jgi:hypothetical protein
MIWILTFIAAACFVSTAAALLVDSKLASKLHRAEATIHRLRREATVAYVKRHTGPDVPAWVNAPPRTPRKEGA